MKLGDLLNPNEYAINMLSQMYLPCFSKEEKEALTMGIHALERLIARRPIYGKYDDNGDGEIIPCEAKCPSCGYEFEFGYWNNEDNHHCVCGQAIDWE